jgi:hypothetical protein
MHNRAFLWHGIILSLALPLKWISLFPLQGISGSALPVLSGYLSGFLSFLSVVLSYNGLVDID